MSSVTEPENMTKLNIKDNNRIYWNPWMGCIKKSEGCQNCFMFSKAEEQGKSGDDIYKNDKGFMLPVERELSGEYAILSGELIRVSMFSDFFLEEADPWREAAWNIIRERKDLIFFLLTKRPERIRFCLPNDWKEGWENVIVGVSCENQKRADERIPILAHLPFKHKMLMLSPLIGEISLCTFMPDIKFDLIVCDEENHEGHRTCDIEWVRKLKEECFEFQTNFLFEGNSAGENLNLTCESIIIELDNEDKILRRKLTF